MQSLSETIKCNGRYLPEGRNTNDSEERNESSHKQSQVVILPYVFYGDNQLNWLLFATF